MRKRSILITARNWQFSFSYKLCRFQNRNLTYNLGQKVGDKLTKLSKIGFSMECFTADFCDFLQKNVKIWLSVGRLGTRYQIQAFQRFSGNFLIS